MCIICTYLNFNYKNILRVKKIELGHFRVQNPLNVRALYQLSYLDRMKEVAKLVV